MIAVFLGAGFSFVGGLPLASELFARRPIPDAIIRQRLVERVIRGWDDWHSRTGGTPEQYLTHLEQNAGKEWREAVWYVALAVTLQTPGVRVRGIRPTVVGQSLAQTCRVEIHNEFWSAIFEREQNVSVLTTNYDILAEQGLRPRPMPRSLRPGFHYGIGAEQLKGSVPGVLHSQVIEVMGNVPLLKLHGSVSWAYGTQGIERFHDCRPAIRGDAAIIAPVTEKSVPSEFEVIWRIAERVLCESHIWIVVGYSFPEYDEAVNKLLKKNSEHEPRIHIVNPNIDVALSAKRLLPRADIYAHPGLPEALNDLPEMVS